MNNFSQIKLGVAPINWCNDDMPELGGDIPLDTCFMEMREAGYTGTEVGHKYPKNPEDLKNLIKNYDLEIASCWHSTFYADSSQHQKEHELLKNRLDFLNKVGSKCVNLSECTRTIHSDKAIYLNQKPHLSESEWDGFIAGIDKAAEICIQHGIKPAYHHHMGTVVQNLDEIKRLMDATDSKKLGLCIDTGHLSYAGIDPLDIIHQYGDRIAHVHLKDLRSEVLSSYGHKVSFLDAVLSGIFTVPGDGLIAFKPIIKAIMDLGYTGWFVVEAEQDPQKANPFEYARKSREYLEQTFHKLSESRER